MTEKISNNYVSLFEIRLIYHARSGADDFDALSAKEQEEYLSAYDSSAFFTIKPTKRTEKKFQESGWIYKKTALGCIVAASSNLLNFSEKIELGFLLNPLTEDLAQYSGKFFSRYEKEELKRYKKILLFSDEQNNTVTENSEGKENSYLFTKKSTYGDSDEDSQKHIYAASVQRKDKIYHRNILLDDDLPADTFALIRLTTSTANDQEKKTERAEQFGKIFEINFEKFETGEEKILTGNDENKGIDSRDSLLQKIKNSLSGR